MTNQKIALEFSHVTKRFGQVGQEDTIALDDVTLQIKQGSFLVIVGHNGSGKTTMLNVVAGDIKPDKGSIRFGERGSRSADTTIARVRQSPELGTFADLTVAQNFQLFLMKGRPSPFHPGKSAAINERAIESLVNYGLESKLNHRVADLSQGQRQLLALELAMARAPHLLLLDEHTASLDRVNAKACMEATKRLTEHSTTTVLMVTHNLAHALNYGDSLVVFRDGKIDHFVEGQQKADMSIEVLAEYCGFDT